MIARLRAIEVPRGAVALLCALVAGPPVAMALAHSPYLDSQGRWIHHHTTSYSYCNAINADPGLRDRANEAATAWENATKPSSSEPAIIAFPGGTTSCHPSGADAKHLQLQDGSFGDTGWRVSAFNSSTASENAGFHATHTHVNFNNDTIGSSWDGYEKRAIACKGIGQAIGVKPIAETQWASESTNNDCMSFINRDQKRESLYPSSFTYSDKPGPHSQTLVVERYASYVLEPVTSITARPPAATRANDAMIAFSSPVASASFECRYSVGGSPGAWASCNSPTQFQALAEGLHQFDVRARNLEGDQDPSPESVAWIVDRTPPQFEADGPFAASPPAYVPGYAEIDLVATDGGSGVTGIELFADNELVEAEQLACPELACGFEWTFTPDVSNLTLAQHNFELVVTDAAGNEAIDVTQVAVDSAAPALTVTGSLPAADNQPLTTGTVSADINITDTGAGNSGVSTAEVLVDGVVNETFGSACVQSCPSSLSGSYSYDAADWDAGSHRVEITTADGSGNRSSVAYLLNAEAPPADPGWSCQECIEVDE